MIKGLDGARGLSVILIMLFHYHVLDLFWIAVQLFYVLSGFLITAILLRQSTSDAGAYFRNFFGRRALRIFPLYFVFLAALAVIGVALNWSQEFFALLPYAATYTYNFQYVLTGNDSVLLTHLWTLSAEEQFYLLWPFIIFLTPRKWLTHVLVAIVLSGPVLRYLAFAVLPSVSSNPDVYHAVYKLPTTHFDAFAIGALLCVFKFRASANQFLGMCFVMLAYGLANVLAGDPALYNWNNLGFPLHFREPVRMALGYTLVNVFWAVMISGIIGGNILPRLFENRLLSQVGAVSYGMYLLHMPIKMLMIYVFMMIGNVPAAGSKVLFVIANVVITFGLAVVLFRTIEKPMLGFKDRLFRYRNSTADIADPIKTSAG